MTDEPEILEEEFPLDIIQDKRGSLMRELESWERIIEGLKQASDGCRHMARFRNPDSWNKLAGYLDSVRKAVIKDGGFDRPTDSGDSVQKFGGEGMPWTMAQKRVADGMKMAAAGADQIANCQRLDMRWVMHASRFRSLADQAHRLAMMSTQRVTDQGFRNTATGLIVPTRLH